MHEFYGNKIEFVRRALVRRLWALLYGSATPLVTDATTQLNTPMLSSSPLDQVTLHTTNGGLETLFSTNYPYSDPQKSK
jgi:hypothetical protein